MVKKINSKNNVVYPADYKPHVTDDNTNTNDESVIRNKLLNFILHSKYTSSDDQELGTVPINTDLFDAMASRRSTRKFSNKPVEPEKVDKIIAAADTAPTAGNYQGFEIFLIRSPKVKEKLVKACNKQPYVNAPLVLVFCKNPSRVKFDFDDYILKKFAIQDATLAAGYSQLAAQALGLSSIWIGMFDEKMVMDAIGTDLVPSSLLCVGYPKQTKYPKPRRNLSDLVHVVYDEK